MAWSESIVNTSPVFFKEGALMRKITIWLIITFLWFVFLLSPIIHYATQVRFPVIAPEKSSKFILILLFLLPAIFAFIAKFTKKEKITRIVFIVCTVLNLASIYVLTLGFTADVPFFYPVISYTDSAQDYLVLDTNLYTDDVFSVFPETIPSEAKDVKYKYYCELSSNTVQLFAEWILPNKEYILEKNRLAVGYNDTSMYDYSSFVYNLVVEFDDQNNTVCYMYEQGDFVK